MLLSDLFPEAELDEALEQGYVRRQSHPELPLAILNYTEKAAYDRAWNRVTLQCRGLIYEWPSIGLRVVARPFPKFFNYGEPDAPELDLEAPAVVTDKMDGSLGILYPTGEDRMRLGGEGGYAIATRGSFSSEQAFHATEVWRDRYEGRWAPLPGTTALFEIVYPENRVVLDYGKTDDLFLLGVLSNESGLPVTSDQRGVEWPGPRSELHFFSTLRAALEAEPRENAEGYVVYLPATGERVKLKQADYVALHRILTGTNARHVYEFAAVRACTEAIDRLAEGRDRGKLWASYVGLDPARVDQLEQLGEDWLAAAGVPDEFYGWVRGVIDACEEQAGQTILDVVRVATDAAEIEDRRARYLYVEANAPTGLASETMRLASAPDGWAELARVVLRAWREAVPAPTAPFQRSEAIA